MSELFLEAWVRFLVIFNRPIARRSNERGPDSGRRTSNLCKEWLLYIM